MRSAFVLLLASGCASDGIAPNARLADLPSPTLAVQGWSPSDANPTDGLVALAYDARAFRDQHGGECAVVGSFGGTLDGVALVLESHGGGDGFGGCAPLALEFNAVFSGGSTFVIEDDSMTVTAEFSPEAFAPHVPTLRSPGNWQFSPGETVRVGWSHPADLEMLPLEPFLVYFHTGKIENNNSFDLAPEYAGDEIRFTIPDPPPVAGAGFIVFQFGYSNGTATRCTGATSCRFSSTRGYEHTVVIAR